MKALSNFKVFRIVFAITTGLLVLDTSLFYSEAFGQGFENNNTKKYDIVLLNQRYSSEGSFTDEIVGSILNNGTATIKAVEMTAIFYDDQDDIIGNADSGTSPYTINPGDRAAFTIEIFDEAIKINASSYDFTAKWKDEHLSNNYFTRLIGGEISDNNNGEEDGDDDD